MLTVRESLEKKLNEIVQLPTRPEILFMVDKAMRDETAGADRIARIIREDPSLTTSVLRVANSIIYRGQLSSKISSVKIAVARLGFSEVQRICISTILIRSFKAYGAGIDHDDFWKHCLTVGLATRIFLNYTSNKNLLKKDEIDDAFVAGLLHDIGLLIMDQYFPEQLAEAQALARTKLIALAKAEQELFGIHHGEIGGILLKNWDLPERVVAGVTWHHDPDYSKPEFRHVAQMVHLADFICVNQSIGQALEGLYDGFSAGAWYDLGLSVDQAPSILEDLKVEMERSEIMRAA